MMVLYLILALVLFWVWQQAAESMILKTLPYSDFRAYVDQGQVVECTIREGDIEGRIDPTLAPLPKGALREENRHLPSIEERSKPDPSAAAREPAGKDEPTEPFLFRTIAVTDETLVSDLLAVGTLLTGSRPSLLTSLIWAWIVPIGLMVLIWFLLMRRMGGMGQRVLSFGKSRAKITADKSTGVTFEDVAGCDEAKAELQEVVSFLNDPSRYQALGAKIPKGVLLVGPPGTGKTLIARAVAGEAGVPFFSMSGSDFVEMFVGVGAARVRDLFEQAKSKAPCIIFIDEVDAIGRQRGVHLGAVNDEREQTLNQLLAEMDGFEANKGVIILAATNRPDVLDRALLRPGRFDRQVVVDAPDLLGREAILKVHSKGKPLAKNVDLKAVAQRTPGFSGADLANTLNEAALLAARLGATEIAQEHLQEAIEKVVAGPERRTRRLNDDEKRRVAFHEVGHALVATFSPSSDPVQKITIVPRGRAALGYTMQVPVEDRYLMTRTELVQRIKGLLGGRAAEDIVYGEVSTGAENDLDRATKLARQMVCMYGMSDRIGLVHCGRDDYAYLGSPNGAALTDCSQETSRVVDEEVRRLLDDAFTAAKDLLLEKRPELDAVAEALLSRESLDGKAFQQILSTVAARTGAGAPPAGSEAQNAQHDTLPEVGPEAPAEDGV
jgi:cell division protease FtsH